MSPQSSVNEGPGANEGAAGIRTETPLGEARFDEARFREVMSHYPTGVVIVTAATDEGHVGMVVGSFTSVSLKPPLVAFLADHGSRTYKQLRKARHFIVNILSADQEDLCRRFASRSVEDKWADVAWEVAGNGVRKLVNAVAHVECTHTATHAAGDHDIVLGQVEHLAAENPVLPLLFFQGAFGKFTPRTHPVPSHLDVADPLRLSDIARPYMEGLAQELGAVCVAQARVQDELIFLASARGGEDGRSSPRVGRRIPHIPPLGALFMAWEPDDVSERWLTSLGSDIGEAELETLRAGLKRVRERGFSLVLEAEEYGPLEQVSDRFTDGQATPAEVRFIRGIARHLIKNYEPATIPQGGTAGIRMICAPVFEACGKVGLVLQVWNPSQSGSRDPGDIARRLIEVTRQVEGEIGAARPAPASPPPG